MLLEVRMYFGNIVEVLIFQLQMRIACKNPTYEVKSKSEIKESNILYDWFGG